MEGYLHGFEEVMHLEIVVLVDLLHLFACDVVLIAVARDCLIEGGVDARIQAHTYVQHVIRMAFKLTPMCDISFTCHSSSNLCATCHCDMSLGQCMVDRATALPGAWCMVHSIW